MLKQTQQTMKNHLRERRRDSILEGQNEMKGPKDQTEGQGERNHISLPPVLNREYMFHTQNKTINPYNYTRLSLIKQLKSKSSIARYSPRQKESQALGKSPTIYNVEFKHYRPPETNLMNCTSIKGINQRSVTNKTKQINDKAQTRYFIQGMFSKQSLHFPPRNQVNMIVLNSQTIDFMERYDESKNYNDHQEKDLSTRQADIINKYQHRFLSPKFNQLNNSKSFNKSTNKNFFLGKNKDSIDLEAFQYDEKDLISTKKKIYAGSNNPEKAEKKMKKQRRIFLRNSFEGNKQKMHEARCSPWQNTQLNQEQEDFLGIDNNF